MMVCSQIPRTFGRETGLKNPRYSNMRIERNKALFHIFILILVSYQSSILV